MTSRDDIFLKSLASRPADEDLQPARIVLDELEKELEAFEDPDYATLISRRIMASNTLTGASSEREAWDRGNAFVAQEIAQDHSPSLEGLLALNRVLTATHSEFRTVPVFAGHLAYLSVAFMPRAQQILNELILTETDSPLKASLLYLWVSAVHPFENGNGRTARLAADWVLLAAGLPPLCFQTALQSHVCFDVDGNFMSIQQSVNRCFAALENSYKVLLRR